MNNLIDNYNFHNMEYQYWYKPRMDIAQKKEFYRNLIFSGQWWGAEYKDGVLCKIIKDMKGKIFVLTSGSINYKDYLPHLHDYFNELENGTCLIGLMYLRGKPSEKVNHLLNCLPKNAIVRQEQEGKVYLYIFDIVALEGESWINRRALSRIDELNVLWKAYPNGYVDYADYSTGTDFWNNYQYLVSKNKKRFILINGGEKYQPSAKKKTIGLELDDCLKQSINTVIIGVAPPTKIYTGDLMEWQYWYDIKKDEFVKGRKYDDFFDGAPLEPITRAYFYKDAGTFKIGLNKNDKLVQVGEVRAPKEMCQNWKNYIGAVVEVCDLIIQNDKVLDGMISRKIDMKKRDCVYEQMYE